MVDETCGFKDFFCLPCPQGLLSRRPGLWLKSLEGFPFCCSFMGCYCFLPIALATLVLLAAPLIAQKQKPTSRNATSTLLAQADSAFDAGQLALARRLYARVLRADPDNSRATYQLGRLVPEDPKLTIRLFRRYVFLEPNDPWGYMALAEAFAEAGLLGPAVRWYVEAVILAPTEHDPWIGLGRILERTGRVDASVEVYERWARVRPRDPVAWTTLGQARQRTGRLREAAYTFEHALAMKQDEATMKRLRHVLANVAPAITPLFGRSWDSDGNVVYQGAIAANWMALDRTRLGIKLGVTQAENPRRSATANEFTLTASWQPRSNLVLDGRAGLVQTNGSQNPSSRTTPVLHLRTRWHAPAGGPAGELRVNIAPLISTPLLLAQPVVLKEIHGLMSVPAYGPIRLRTLGQLGALKSDTHQNTRLGYGGALALRLASGLELSGQYRALDYRRPTKAGYFAPDLLQTVEVASYLEYSRFWPFMLTLDLGLGAQRATPHDRTPLPWGRALRLWALIAWNFQPGSQLALEIESYESVTPGEALAPAYGWRSNAVILSLRWGLGPIVGAGFSGIRTKLAESK
jgi:tetratricopeptide (TPR) repeat protein